MNWILMPTVTFSGDFFLSLDLQLKREKMILIKGFPAGRGMLFALSFNIKDEKEENCDFIFFPPYV